MRLGEDPLTNTTGIDINTLLPSILQFEQQQKLIDINVDRANRGLPPIDISQITPGVNVGISPDVKKLLYTALGAGIVLYLMRR